MQVGSARSIENQLTDVPETKCCACLPASEAMRPARAAGEGGKNLLRDSSPIQGSGRVGANFERRYWALAERLHAITITHYQHHYHKATRETKTSTAMS